MNRFEIGIPTLNRSDLLLPALENYCSDFFGIDIHILDNGRQSIGSSIHKFNTGLGKIKLYESLSNFGVAGSWNFLCKKIFEKHDYALIINDDVYLGYKSEVVEKVIDKYPHTLIQSFSSWSVFLISKRLYNQIGEFDEEFYPAYYEDSDYLYRMKLEGILQEVDADLNPKVLRTSMTYEKAPEMIDESKKKNRDRYVQKWGGMPLLELFNTPFGL